MKKSLTLIAVVALLVVISVFVFAACVPSDPTKAKTKYEDKGYSVIFDNSKAGNVAAKVTISLLIEMKGDVAAKLIASNSSYSGTIIWFTESADAKTYEKYLKSNKSEDSTTYIKRDGKAVFAGDKEAYNMKKAD